MAAAYAAVMSLMNTINLILQKDKFRRIFDLNGLRSLQENATTMQTFLESSQTTNEEVKYVEVQIRDAAHKTHDVIDSYISNFILKSKSHGRVLNRYKLQLQKATEEIACISKEVKNMPGGSTGLPSDNFFSASSSSPVVTLTDRNARSTMIGFEEDLVQIKIQISGNQSGLQIIPIVGMGGSGKTTLARNVYDDSLIVHHFHVRAWATVSQEYNSRDIILSLLGNDEKLHGERDIEDLGVDLHKRLKGRRYLIILDDVWETKLYDDVRRFFPNDDNGSRIILTTRQLDVAEYAGSLSFCHRMSFLDEDGSWNLLKNKVFGGGECPQELEDIGRVIARGCKGLPLVIVVIGGFLAKAHKTTEYWQDFSENLSPVITLNEEECMGILYLSYRYLPPHLKPCFLYMGAFPEDYVVDVSRLVHLWMAEGFLKQLDRSKSLSEVAHEYVEDLIDRNLILVDERDINGKAKSCKIHDVLRELCRREAKKENFLYVFEKQVLEGAAKEQRRVAICNNGYNYHRLPFPTQSLICSTASREPPKFRSQSLKILDMLETEFKSSPKLLELVNIRYIAFRLENDAILPSSLSRFWNLQTLILQNWDGTLPSDIWEMSDLKYIDIDGFRILAPPIVGDSEALENLEIIYGFQDINWTEKVIKKLPNLKKLRIFYRARGNLWNDKHLYNLRLLQKLEELDCKFNLLFNGLRHSMVQWLPESLKELSLEWGQFPWSAMTNIGSLPNLQVLSIRGTFSGAEWEPNEGEFLQLLVLELDLLDLKNWSAESSHFPLLRHLVLNCCYKLKEIPSGIGEIPTLEKIEVRRCNRRCVKSAKQILYEQREEYGNDTLQVIVNDESEPQEDGSDTEEDESVYNRESGEDESVYSSESGEDESVYSGETEEHESGYNSETEEDESQYSSETKEDESGYKSDINNSG